MRTNQAGIGIIKMFEGCKLKCYDDAVGIPTIGYGHVIKSSDGIGDEITQQEAFDLLAEDIEQAEKTVNSYIHVNLNDNQFSALVCLVFNLGGQVLRGSVGQYLNAGDYEAAADAFLKWVYAGKTILKGLVKRREKERELFLTPIEENSDVG